MNVLEFFHLKIVLMTLYKVTMPYLFGKGKV